MTGLNDWLALLEKRHSKTIDLGLERCGAVYRRLGSPRPARRVFTVAGTNGKGSTVAYLEAMSKSMGHRHGSYTSPHISRFNERIKIMGEPVSDVALVDVFRQVEQVRGEISLSYFEFTTIAGLLLLHQAELDCAVLEVGLGGRLDAVNLVDTDCAVITPIGLDHQEYLGPDIDSIAAEKAGIVRADVPLVCTEQQPPAPVLQIAAERQARVYRRGFDFDLHASPAASTESGPGMYRFSLGAFDIPVPAPPMSGKHQLDNLAAALAAFVLLNPNSIENVGAISSAIRNCSVPGRLQVLHDRPEILVDVGHNELAAAAVAAYLEQNGRTGVVCILAMLADKPVESVARVLHKVCARWLCVGTSGSRGLGGNSLARRVKKSLPGAAVEHRETFQEAFEEAISNTDGGGTVLVFGSFSIVADAMNVCR